MSISGAEHPALVGRVGCAAANVNVTNVTNVTAENAALRANGAPNAVTASELAQRLHARRSGNGWIARCPAHDDRTPSLSIGEGNDGRVLLRCFAGCDVRSICAALNIQARDLFNKRSTLAVELPLTDTQRNTEKNADNQAHDHVHGVSEVSRSLVGQYSVNESVNESVNAPRGKSVSDAEIKEKGVLSFFTKDEQLIYWRFQKHGKRRKGFNCLWGYMYDKARAGAKWATPPVERLKQKLGCKSIQGVYHFLNHLEAIGVLESEPYDRKAGHKRIRWAIPTNIWKMANGTYDDEESVF